MSITLEKLQEIAQTESVENAIQFAKDSYDEYPSQPRKPFLKNNANSTEVLEYAELLKNWEIDNGNHKVNVENYRKNINQINEVIVEFIKDESGLNSIPEQYREKVYAKAWSDGHSNGYHEVYSELVSLVELFD
jgi:hypothetical protein